MPQQTEVSRLRLSPGEVERILREENQRRRKLRLIQVREKAKEISKKRLEAVRQEKVKQLELLADRIESEWQMEKQNRITQLERDYAESLKNIGTAHTQADELDLGLERKAAAEMENNRRADERHEAALEKLYEDKLIQEAESTKVIQARNLALAKEKMRAKQVASLPPPVRPDLKELLNKAKAVQVQLTDADTYTYPYTIPAEECIVERNNDSVCDGLTGAELENDRLEGVTHHNQCDINERLEKARVRGAHALKRERMRQHYNNMMSELDVLEKADRKHRQQNLEHIPQALFLPAHVVMERESDRQVQMERKVEELFSHDYDPVDLKANAPPLNYDLTPTVTEATSTSSPSDSEARPPISRVRDGDSVRGRVPFQNVTNITPVTTSEATCDYTEATGSEKKRKAVLNKMMKRIANQKEQWVSEEVEGQDDEDVALPADQVQTGCHQGGKADDVIVLPAVVDTEAKTSSETTSNQSLEQVYEVTYSEEATSNQSTNETISQTRVTSSEGDTTTSSQFIEKQRKELMEYMKSLETQIGELQTLKSEKSLLDKEEQLADRLERKLTNLENLEAETYDLTDSTVPHVDCPANRDSLSLDRSARSTDTQARRPGESTWDWYLRQKSSLGESIKHKLNLITSSERGYEMDSRLENTADQSCLQQSHRPIRLEQEPSNQMAKQSQVAEARQNMYFVPPDHRAEPGAGHVTAGDDNVIDRPRPTGYVTVTDREMLARGEIPSRMSAPEFSRDEYDGDTLHGLPFPTVKYMRTEATPPEITPLTRGTEGNMFVSVEERERLMRAPLDGHSSENRKKTQDGNFEGTASRGPKEPSALQSELQEHSRRLERLQDMMSSVKLDRFVRPNISNNADNQSRSDIHPQEAQPARSSASSQSKPTYMSIDERERLLHAVTRRFIAKETDAKSAGSGLTWAEALASGPSDTSPVRSGIHLTEPTSAVPQSSASVPQDEIDSEWSPLHQQMMAKQQEFNKRQEELRRQLADIQDQKRKLLSPSTSQRELLDTQNSLRHTLHSLGIELDEEQSGQSTPSRDIPLRPPVTAKAGVDDLDLHELSVIQEVDTPTHITTFDETLYPSMNMNSNARGKEYSRSLAEQSSISLSSMDVPPITITDFANEPITDQHYYHQPIRGPQPNSDTHLSSTSTSADDCDPQRASSKVQSVTSSDSPTPPLSGFTALMTSAAPIISTPGDVEHTGADVEANSPDGERIRVLNQLLQQLESRRADRQKFLEQEKLTTLDGGMTSQGLIANQQSPTILDLYSSDSADDFVVPAAAPSYSTDSQESTPSGDTLTRQMRHISHQWRGVPVSVPEHVAEEFTSPSAEAGETPSSDERQSAADQSSGSNQSKTPRAEISSSTETENSQTIQNIEDILQTISSDDNVSSHCKGQGQKPGQGHSMSQLSEQSSTPSRAGELTQVTDQSVGVQSLVQSEKSPQTVSAGQSDTSSTADSFGSPMKTLAADQEETIFSVDDMLLGDADISQSTPMKITISSRPSSSTPQKPLQDTEHSTGLLEEPEITFASTIPDESNLTLVEEPQTAGSGDDEQAENVGEVLSAVPGLQWIEEEPLTEAQTRADPDVRPKTSVRTLDSAARKKQKKEMTERTKRLYGQLEEVKQKRAYKAREAQKVDVQARRKEYGSKLLARSKKSS